MKKALIPASLLLVGAALGVLSKLLDIYTQNLGNIFSQMSVWVLLGTAISRLSRSGREAAVNVFTFCVGMLIAYYLTAEWMGSAYSMTFVYGWTAFSLVSPVFAYLAWKTKQPGVFPAMISAGILLATLAMSAVLFDGPRVYDWIILAALAWMLYGKRKGRA